MRLTWNRILSALVGAIYLIMVIRGVEAAGIVALFLIMPLACIWFADAMGGYTGPTTSMAITEISPATIVRILGWLVLLLPVVVGAGYAIFGSRA